MGGLFFYGVGLAYSASVANLATADLLRPLPLPLRTTALHFHERRFCHCFTVRLTTGSEDDEDVHCRLPSRGAFAVVRGHGYKYNLYVLLTTATDTAAAAVACAPLVLLLSSSSTPPLLLHPASPPLLLLKLQHCNHRGDERFCFGCRRCI